MSNVFCFNSHRADFEAIKHSREQNEAQRVADRTNVELRDPRNWSEGLAYTIDHTTPHGARVIACFMSGDLLEAATLMASQIPAHCEQMAQDAIDEIVDEEIRHADEMFGGSA